MCSIIRYIKLFSAVLKLVKKTVLVILRDFVSDLVLHRAYTKCKHVGHLITPWESSEVNTAKKRVESILDFQLICHLHSVNGLYQNVSDKSIENQELTLHVFLLCHEKRNASR